MKKIKEKFLKIKSNIHELPKKKKVLLILLTVILLAVLVFISTLIFDRAPKNTYEVAVMVRSQQNSDKEEDLKSSLKTGDVLVVQPEGHDWSDSELISYLIIKMSLTEEQKEKIVSPEKREIKFKELSEEEQTRIKEEKEKDKKYAEEVRFEILRARAYHINMKTFEEQGFNSLSLLNGQPFENEIYDWRIVNKKERVKN